MLAGFESSVYVVAVLEARTQWRSEKEIDIRVQ